jgi:hypothetical protein
MKTLWEDVKKWLGEASQTVAKEAELLTRKGKLKLELYDINRRLEKTFADLGGIVYDEGIVKKKRGILQSKKVVDIVQQVQKLEAKREEKLLELKSVDDAVGRKIKNP